MSEVKRYYQSVEYKDAAHMKEHPEGEYVLYSDYENIKAQLERAEEVLSLIAAPGCNYKSFETETTERLIECIVADTDFAREYFKEKEKEQV